MIDVQRADRPVRDVLPELHVAASAACRPTHRLADAQRCSRSSRPWRACSASPTSKAVGRSRCASGSTRTAWPPSTWRPATSTRPCSATTTWPPSARPRATWCRWNLLADTDLRSVEEFEQLIVTDRDGAVVRIADVARVELGAEEADMVAKFNGKPRRLPRRLAARRRQRDRRRRPLRREMERIKPHAASGHRHALAYDGTYFMRERARPEITKTLAETIAIVGLVVFLFMGSIRTALVPLVAMPVSLIGACDRHAAVRLLASTC
jgi:hypothetical protein